MNPLIYKFHLHPALSDFNNPNKKLRSFHIHSRVIKPKKQGDLTTRSRNELFYFGLIYVAQVASLNGLLVARELVRDN